MKTIKDYFKENGESFGSLAKTHQISKSYLSRVVNGVVGCSMNHFVMIAKWVKMPRNEALDEWTNRMCGRIKSKATKEKR